MNTPKPKRPSLSPVTKVQFLARHATINEEKLRKLDITWGTQPKTHRVIMSESDWARARAAKAVEELEELEST